MTYDRLILAVGSKSNKFGWPGQDLDGVQGLYNYQDLENMERHAQKGVQRAVIIGGGLIGVEMAEMWHSRGVPVTFLVREGAFWSNVLPMQEAQMVSRHLTQDHHIDLRHKTELDRIEGDANGQVTGIKTKSGESIDCQFVGLTVGVSPNIDFLKNTALRVNRGIVVNEYLETNIPHVYAIGDCAEIEKPQAGRRNIEAIWYTGRMMGETVAHTICGNSTAYQPQRWFNSAKFFDIEYQVYGEVPSNLPNDVLDTFYWEHPNGKKSVRLVFEKTTGIIRGFNLMGIRYRHEVCEKWLSTPTHLEEVLANLSLANFDPEFYKEYEPQILAQYNQKFGKNLKIQQRRRLSNVFAFLRQAQ